MTITTSTIREQIESNLNMKSTALSGRGGYGMGFWHFEVQVDLEELKKGNINRAMKCREVHDTEGYSFRANYGIDKTVKLPDCVLVSSLLDLFEEIWGNREALTAGFSVEWDGSNHKACWTVNDDDYVVEDAQEWWDGLDVRVNDLSRECV